MSRLLSILSAIFALFILLSFGPGVTKAEASCRTIVNPPTVGSFPLDDTAVLYTDQYTVPSSSVSTCHDINIRDISYDNGNPACAYFGVWFFPSSGMSYINKWTYICTATSHVDIPIATNVLNGTHYRVAIKLPSDYAGFDYDYTLRD